MSGTLLGRLGSFSTYLRLSVSLAVSIHFRAHLLHCLILINVREDYSSSLNGRQGWLYISENYLGFYSFLLGIETKRLIELKDIEDIKKENSKRAMFADSLRITTKDKEEVRDLVISTIRSRY